MTLNKASNVISSFLIHANTVSYIICFLKSIFLKSWYTLLLVLVVVESFAILGLGTEWSALHADDL